jgi:CRISPR type II-A-associated protein Csn2
MKLMHPILSAPIVWRENHLPVVVLESPVLFRQWVFMLSAQAAGEAGDFVLVDGNDMLDCGRELIVITDYSRLPLENRRLQLGFQNFLQQVAREDLAADSDAFNQAAQRYLGRVATALDYPSAHTEGDYALLLLKALKFQLCLEAEEPLGQLAEYLRCARSFLANPCFVLVGAHLYFSPAELLGLYQLAAYQKWRLLLLEASCFPSLKGEEYYVIDEGMCELRLDLETKID